MKSKKESEMEIAGKLTIDKWDELKEKLDPSKDENWEEAFKFFEKRIETRYLRPIQAIQSIPCNLGEGFAMVNLQCSLIETIESFVNGWIYKYNGSPKYYLRDSDDGANLRPKVKGVYIFNSFFERRLGLLSSDYESFKDSFFYHVRCGLLHETQTKNGWLVHAKHPDESIFFDKKGERTILFRDNFQRAIEKVIQDYKTAIISKSDFGELKSKDLRINFKAKIDNICTISK